MEVLSKFVDMAQTAEEAKEGYSIAPSAPSLYPYGLCISLTEKELEKLELDDDCAVGDMIHLHALGKVTSVTKNDTSNGAHCRIEIQLTHVACEDESSENEEYEEEMEETPHLGRKNPYKK